ncbi:MAG: hypothetical protein K8S99_18075 [Planctomycetes bacterium]|nr:hypothetical protein [Planctomycetota bacterium]
MATLALIAPTFSELRATAHRLEARGTYPIFEASFPGHKVVLGVVGVGENAMHGAARVITEHRPDAMALIGVAGGLNADLKVGALVRLSRCVDERGENFALHGPAGREVMSVLTADRIADTPDRKRVLREKYDADVVDMETAHVAKIAADMRVPLASARVVSDAADEALPADFMSLVTPDGRADTWAAVRLCLRRPTHIRRLIRLGITVDKAGATLAEWSERWLADF